jgi:hypothetical protein
MKTKYVGAGRVSSKKRQDRKPDVQQVLIKEFRKLGFRSVRTILGAHIMCSGTLEIICTKSGRFRESRQSVSVLDMIGTIGSIVRHQMRHPLRMTIGSAER